MENKEKFTYAVRRINNENGKWDLVKSHKDFQHDDKFIVQFNKDAEGSTDELIDYFVKKVATMNKGILAKKALQINFKRETNGLTSGQYQDGTEFVKCFGVISYAQGSSITESLDY